MRAQILNYGGGRQTVALCLLVLDGKMPRPDHIVIADTGREAQSTWDYLDQHVAPRLATIGLGVERAPHSLARVDLHGRDGTVLLPVYTATGKLSTYCSTEWKARVIQRYLRAQGLREADHWIGFALDERSRIKAARDAPWYRVYPLVDAMLSKADCLDIIAAHGLPLPAKSACYMCPHRSNAEWRHIRESYPEQWADAVRIDDDLRAADERGGVFLHQSRVPLACADLDAPDRQPERLQCGLGNCFL